VPPLQRVLPTVAVAVSVVLVDQLTKWWALEALQDDVIDLFWTLRFNLVFNEGTAFSLGGGMGWLFGVLALVVSVLLLRWASSLRSLPARLAVGGVIGGAIGNVIDRAFRAGDGFLGGRVVDFIDVQWWPVFNVADIGIVVGAAVLVLLAMVGGETALGPPDPERSAGVSPPGDEPEEAAGG
jgi:signal peptidase II